MFFLQTEKNIQIINMDFNKKKFNKLTTKSIDIIQKWFDERIRGKKIFYNKSVNEISEIFKINYNNNEKDPEEILDFLKKHLIETSNFNPSPNYYGYITGSGNQIAIIASIFKNALNQNNLKWNSAPGNTEIEKIVVDWIAKFIGYPLGFGVLVSGGSIGNLMNIAIMRKIKSSNSLNIKGLYQHKIMRVYVSKEAHSSIDKAMDILGLGTENLIKIKSDNNFKIKITDLENAIKKDIKNNLLPIGIIGIAGTTNTGSVDPLMLLGKIANKYNLWYMIDAAYGGPAVRSKNKKNLFKGIEKADSILVNPHKWLYVPFEVACVMVKNKENLKKTFSLIPEYLKDGENKEDREDLMNYNIQLTKDFKALKVWMTIKTYGINKIINAIQNDIEITKYAYQIVTASNDFKAINKPELSIFCFQYIGKTNDNKLNELNKKIIELIEEDGRVFLSGTLINNTNVLRINCINHRRKKSDIDFLFKILRELGEKASILIA